MSHSTYCHRSTHTPKEKTMPTHKTTNNAAGRGATGISRRKDPRSRQPVRISSARFKSNRLATVRTLRLKGQRLLRYTKQFSKSQRDECYRKVASLPLAKQQTFWESAIALLKKGAAKAADVGIAVYTNHWNSLLWAAAGLSLGWLAELLLTVYVPFVGTVRLAHWAWKWLCAAAGAAYGIGFDHDYRLKTAAVAFA